MTAPAPAGKFEWQRLILSLDIPTLTKAAALTLSTYGSRNGSNCHPGNELLAWAMNCDEKTVRRHLAVLRDELRLIERTFYGQQAGRRGLSDCYQLVIPWDLATRAKIRDYDQEHRTPESADTDQEHRTPESADNPPGNSGTPDSGAGTPDSRAGSPDSRVHTPGSTHQVGITPAADSIVAPVVPSPDAQVEVPAPDSDQDPYGAGLRSRPLSAGKRRT